MAGTTTRLAIPYPVAPADSFHPAADIAAVASAMDNVAMYEQGAIGSIPAPTSKPNGYWYADTAAGGRVWVNVGTGGGRAYRSLATGVEHDTLGTTVSDNATKVDNLAGVWRTIDVLRSNVGVTQLPDAALHVLVPNLADTATAPLTASLAQIGIFPFDPADYAVAGRTTKLRLRVGWVTNGAQSGRTTLIGLFRPNTLSSGQITSNTVITTDSYVSFANPAANTATQAVSTAPFDPPTAGPLFYGIAATGSWASSAFASVTVYLQAHYV